METGFRPHRHRRCVDEALARAEALCRARGVRFTALRRRVLELVWESHRPVGAYEILARLGAESGQTPAPPTVYRALDFLLAQGFVHRIASQNAYLGCVDPGRPHRGQFFVCARCGNAAELADPQIDAAIGQTADRLDFLAEGYVVEVFGLCPTCRQEERSQQADGRSA